MKSFDSKLLEGLALEQKFELAVRCLCDVGKEMAFQELRLLELTDRLESLLDRAEARSWEKVIRKRMEELKRNEKHRSGKGAAHNRSAERQFPRTAPNKG